MSSNKMKYYEVVTTNIVSANSKTDALAIVNRTTGWRSLGRVISSETVTERVLASKLASTV